MSDKSDLDKATKEYLHTMDWPFLREHLTELSRIDFKCGALHLLEVAEQFCKGISEIDPRIKQGTLMQANALLTFLKSYCGRE